METIYMYHKMLKTTERIRTRLVRLYQMSNFLVLEGIKHSLKGGGHAKFTKLEIASTTSSDV